MRSWDELLREKKDTLVSLARQAELEAMEAHVGPSGWTIDVVIDREGICSLEGPRPTGTITRAEWDGKAITAYSAKCEPFDLEYAMDCIEWPEDLMDFINTHTISLSEPYDYAQLVYVDAEPHYLDKEIPSEIMDEFKRNMIDAIDIEAEVLKMAP